MKKLRTLRTLMIPSSQRFGASSHGGLPTTSVSSKDLKPPQPPDNRLNANWKLLLQIAQHAGGGWPEQARRSAIYLSRAPYEPSVGVQLLAVLRAMFTKNRTEITSEQAVQELLADPDSPWHEYRGRGPITKNQVAGSKQRREHQPQHIALDILQTVYSCGLGKPAATSPVSKWSLTGPLLLGKQS